ncbi:MAG: iron complex outermembrane receptor protein [Paraglaciecola psychrophila]
MRQYVTSSAAEISLDLPGNVSTPTVLGNVKMNLNQLAVLLASCITINTATAQNAPMVNVIEETIVIADRIFSDTTLVSPTSRITAAELQAINLLTSEDAVAFEPSLVIRRRYVGDPNGTIGIRGSGMFQTTRSMVFADGLPLHYLLQTRFSGSPRWSLVGPDEIDSVDVIYGPYSAEYSGNAMGGVVDIKTRTPQRRRITVQGTMISQNYNELGTDDRFGGDKLFLSYEDKLGDFSVFASYNRLDNKSQPLTDYFLNASEAENLAAAGVTGAINGKNDTGERVIYIGDSGAESSETKLYKLKLGYDLGTIALRGTVAYEKRAREQSDKRNYLVDGAGNSYYGAGNRNFEERFQQRNSLLLGFGVSGEIGLDWTFDVYATDFEIKKDREIRSGLSSQDPAFGSRSGRLTRHGDTGWNTVDIKLGTQSLLGNEHMRLSVGYFTDDYRLEITPANIDAQTQAVISPRAASQGSTSTQALFAQWGLTLNSQWDLALGLRYEDWETADGFFNGNTAPDRSDSGSSPKFSLAYTPNDDWSIRYSVARALRFPISEELYRNEEATTSFIVSDVSLAPEEGVFHNLTIDRQIEGGLLRLNLFFDLTDDTIYNQTGIINDAGTNVRVSTFLAIDEVESKGIEFVYNQSEVLGSQASLRFNTTYTDATITANSANPDIVGNELPRVPQWRANLIVNYPVTHAVDLSASFRYASNTFGDLDNGDTQNQVYGAIDQYLFVGAKANWRVNDEAKVSLGVDNLFDELAYVAHPWPSRTVYLEGKYSF